MFRTPVATLMVNTEPRAKRGTSVFGEIGPTGVGGAEVQTQVGLGGWALLGRAWLLEEHRIFPVGPKEEFSRGPADFGGIYPMLKM
jgi:hypothetical protein